MTLSYIGALVTIAAFDLEKMTQFYQQLFQQEPIDVRPHSYAEFRVVNLRLGIFHPNEKSKAEFAAAAKNPLSICLEVSDLDAAIGRLKSLGYAPAGRIIEAAYGREIYAYDPESNRLIIYQPGASEENIATIFSEATLANGCG